MKTFPTGTQTILARCLSAELRGLIAKWRWNQRQFAKGAGWRTHNYVAKRLRDEAPFTLDDYERICEAYELDPLEFMREAVDNNYERLMMELSNVTETPQAALHAIPEIQDEAARPGE